MAELIFIDDVCDQPHSEEQRRLMKRMWAGVKRRGHWRCSPFTTTDPFIKFMGIEPGEAISATASADTAGSRLLASSWHPGEGRLG